MKHKTLLFKTCVLFVSLLVSGFANLQAQTLLYSNDFEAGLNGSTIVGNGAIEASGNASHGMVFHNAAGGQATRTNYLTLPNTIFADLQTSATNALSISFWVNKGTASNYYWSPIFSAYGAAPAPANGTPMMVLQTRGVAQTNLGGTWCDYSNAQNTKGTNAVSVAWIDDANWHFYTATFTPTNAKVYIDGAIVNEWNMDGNVAGGSAAGLFSVGAALPYICLGGNQAWNWNDPDPAFLFDKLKIYAGALTTAQINSLIVSDGLVAPVVSSTKSALYFDDIYKSESILVNGANLSQDITITAPAGVTVNPTSIPQSSATDVPVTVTWDGTTAVNGTITLTSGSTVTNISVKSSTNACYTPAFVSGNMIADPTFSAASLSAGGFGGWGSTSITYKNPYCGRGTAVITGNCSGSIDRSLNAVNGNALAPNSQYRLRVMLNSKATAGTTFQIQVEGVNGAASIFFPIGNTNGWKQIDTTFTTAATVAEKGIYINACTSVKPANTDTCFIDNYELYNLTAILTGVNTASQNKVGNYVSNNKLVSTFELDAATEVTISVYNLNGMLVKSEKFMGQSGRNERVSSLNMKSGLYIVKTAIDGRYTVNKVIM